MEPKYPDVVVNLTGNVSGNAYAIVGAAHKALRRAGHTDAADEMKTAAFAAENYADLLNTVNSYVETN